MVEAESFFLGVHMACKYKAVGAFVHLNPHGEKARDHRPVGLPTVFAKRRVVISCREGEGTRRSPLVIGCLMCARGMCRTSCIVVDRPAASRGKIQTRCSDDKCCAGDDHPARSGAARWTGQAPAGTAESAWWWSGMLLKRSSEQRRALLDGVSAWSLSAGCARSPINVSGSRSRSRSLVRRMDG
jgi:hypothetical protein